MNGRYFDRIARELAGDSSRRSFLGLVGKSAGSVALTAAIATLFEGPKLAGAQEASPTPTSVALPSAMLRDGRCGVPFELAIRQGPSAGTTISGILAVAIASDGSATGSLMSGDGEVATVTGQIDGQAVALRFDLGGDDVVFGTGVSLGSLGTCTVSDMGGSAVGPKPGDLGDWRQARVDLIDLPEGFCIVGQPCPPDRPDRPEPTHPLPPDITGCDPLSAESCIDVCLGAGLQPSGGACLGYCSEILQC